MENTEKKTFEYFQNKMKKKKRQTNFRYSTLQYVAPAKKKNHRHTHSHQRWGVESGRTKREVKKGEEKNANAINAVRIRYKLL